MATLTDAQKVMRDNTGKEIAAAIRLVATTLDPAGKTAVRYGYRREKNNSNPASRITYLYDAQGMSPAGMTFGSDGVGSWNYGDWKTFIDMIVRPVMLKYDGNVDYELNHDDQTKKLNGAASDIANTSYAGNAMVEFSAAFPWVKRWEDSSYEYVVFCNVQFDEEYRCDAHTNDSGNMVNAFYLGLQAGSYADSKLRSLGTGNHMTNNSAEVEITRAKANGSGYNIWDKGEWDYFADLVTLITKTDNSQAACGTGVDVRKNAIQGCGNLNNCGPFYGTNNGLSCVKILYVVNPYGNMWQRLHGCINDNGNYKIKMHGPFCDTPVSAADYSSYYSSGIVPSGTSGGFQKTSKMSNETGYLWIELAGSDSTYVPDGGWYNNSQVDFALAGASYLYAAGLAGVRCLRVSALASSAGVDFGSRLSFKPV